ncbi:MAG: response regulator [Actinomycetota bacterium]|nr:response regulator [Actinomycetota bacterium]
MKEERRKVLIVDDEERLRGVLEARVGAMGHEVLVAADGEEALARARSDSPDLILLDVMMPELDGFSVARILKDSPETSHIPIVMVTALSDVEDRVRALEAGADDFLTKPVEPTELTARVRSLLKVKAYNDYMRHHQEELELAVTNRTKELQFALDRLEVASLDTIYRLSRAAEYRDDDTGAHVKRVSHCAAIIASQMGQPAAFNDMVLRAAPMHDVGKIGIPDAVLLKPGKLNTEEWRIMQTHVEIGVNLLSGSDSELLQLAETIAGTHHERWDGAGYPNGLAGKTIPLAGRIAAVADVFDAVCSKRPYKEAMTPEDAFTLIVSESDGQFDPEVVDAFVAARDDIMDTLLELNLHVG